MPKLLKRLKSESENAKFLKGIGGSAAIHFASILLTLIVGVLLARLLGPDSFGAYSLVLSVVTVLSLPTKAGLPTLLIREVARYHLNQQWGLIRGVLKLVNRFAVSYSVAMLFVAGMFSYWKWGETGGETATAFLWGVLLLPLLALEGVRAGALRGFRWVLSSQLPEKIIKPSVMVSLLGLTLLYGGQITAITAIQFVLLAAFLAFVAATLLTSRALPKEVRFAEPRYYTRKWVNSLVPLTIFAGLVLLDSHVSIVLLGLLGTAEQVGQFKVAVTTASLISFGLIAVNMALAPQVARLYKEGNKEKLQELISQSTRIVACISFPVAFLFIAFGEEIISFVFGSQYAPAAKALVVLSIGQLTNTCSGSVGLIMNMTGNEKVAMLSAALAVIANAILALLLIPKFGVMGAAAGSTASFVIWNVLLSISIMKLTGIKSYLKF